MSDSKSQMRGRKSIMLSLPKKRRLERQKEGSRKDVKESQGQSQSMARLTKQGTKIAKSQSSQVAMDLPTSTRKSSLSWILLSQSPSHQRQNNQLPRRAPARRSHAPPTVRRKSVKECHVKMMRTVPVDAAQQPWLTEDLHAMP